MMVQLHLVVIASAVAAMFVTNVSADEVFSGDVTVNGVIKAREVRGADAGFRKKIGSLSTRNRKAGGKRGVEHTSLSQYDN